MLEPKKAPLTKDDPGLISPDNILSCFPDILDETLSNQIMIDYLYHGYPRCPWCGKCIPRKEKYYQRFYGNKSITCLTCGRRFTAKGQTILSHMRKTKCRDLIILLFLHRLGHDRAHVADIMNVGRDWVKRWGSKLKLWDRKKLDLDEYDQKNIPVKSTKAIVEMFFDLCAVKDPLAETPASVLYANFCRWLTQETAATMISQKKFGGILREMGLQKRKCGIWIYLGIRINPSWLITKKKIV